MATRSGSFTGTRPGRAARGVSEAVVFGPAGGYLTLNLWLTGGEAG